MHASSLKEDKGVIIVFTCMTAVFM